MVIKAEEVEVTRNNITVREIEDPSGGNALVIQWPEPDSALFGGADLSPNTYQVKVYVGTMPSADVNGATYVFLFYDVPAQAGTCVVEAPSLESLLLKMQEKGFAKSDLRVQIYYRENYPPNWNTNPPTLRYYNRVNSPVVTINE